MVECLTPVYFIMTRILSSFVQKHRKRLMIKTMVETKSKPLKYIIQQKHFSLNDKFVITDEFDNIRYTADSTLLTMGDKLLLYDSNGYELIKICKEYLHLHPIYNIYSTRRDVDEMRLASIKRTGTPWHHKLKIDSVDGKYLIEKNGKISSHEFTLKKN